MKPKRSKKQPTHTIIEGNWIDIDDLVKPGETKEIAEGVWAGSLVMIELDPPEPIKKSLKRKPPTRKK